MIDTTTKAYQLATSFTFPLCLYREDRRIGGADHDARVGIAHVLLNRAANPAGPYHACHDVYSNILQREQFSSFNANDVNAHILPDPINDPIEWPVWVDCVNIVDNLVGTPDPTNGADAYHSYPEGSPNWPKWAVSGKFKVKLGPIWFYKLY